MPPTPPKPNAPTATSVTPQEEDPYLWLEEVAGDKALAWVKAQNERSLKELGTPDQAALKKRLLAIYDSKDKIPYVSKRGKQLYNFWRDDKHVRGLWRRTTLRAVPHEAAALGDGARRRRAGQDGERELGLRRAPPACGRNTSAACCRCRAGGGDAVVVREFDTRAKAFVKDGFILPEAKSSRRLEGRGHDLSSAPTSGPAR